MLLNELPEAVVTPFCWHAGMRFSSLTKQALVIPSLSPFPCFSLCRVKYQNCQHASEEAQAQGAPEITIQLPDFASGLSDQDGLLTFTEESAASRYPSETRVMHASMLPYDPSFPDLTVSSRHLLAPGCWTTCSERTKLSTICTKRCGGLCPEHMSLRRALLTHPTENQTETRHAASLEVWRGGSVLKLKGWRSAGGGVY
jgi:hypothetical protein